MIAVLRDIVWPLIGRGWGSEPSDWSESLDTLQRAYFTFPQPCNYPYQHLIKSHRFDVHILYQHHHHLWGRIAPTLKYIFDHDKQNEPVLPVVSQDICVGITADLC